MQCKVCHYDNNDESNIKLEKTNRNDSLLRLGHIIDDAVGQNQEDLKMFKLFASS